MKIKIALYLLFLESFWLINIFWMLLEFIIEF